MHRSRRHDRPSSAIPMQTPADSAHRASRTECITIRGLSCHVRHWGEPRFPKLFLFHGWMDVSASYQFMVDALKQDWHVIAPDWRGYGQSARATGHPGTESYWFPDYLADLEAVLDHYQPDGQVNLVGHSMGANVVGLYAGIRPQRVRRIVSLEGFGLVAAQATQAPKRYARWLDELKHPPVLRTYATQEDVVARLQKTNPRLSDARAAFLAAHWSQKTADGEWEILADPAHRIVNPVLYRLDEVTAVWALATAPILHVEAYDSETLKRLAGDMPVDAFKTRFKAFADFREVIIDDAGHMLHHDQPERVAALVEAFMAQ